MKSSKEIIWHFLFFRYEFLDLTNSQNEIETNVPLNIKHFWRLAIIRMSVKRKSKISTILSTPEYNNDIIELMYAMNRWQRKVLKTSEKYTKVWTLRLVLLDQQIVTNFLITIANNYEACVWLVAAARALRALRRRRQL
jgi:hypothetical protein